VKKDEDIYGLDIVIADLCRCGCSLIRVHPYSVKSKIPIWKCVWCRKRRGKPTDVERASRSGGAVAYLVARTALHHHHRRRRWAPGADVGQVADGLNA
jgi:hypothetical protein